MKYLLLISILGFVACTQPVKLSQPVKQKAYVIDTSRYAILKFDNERDHYYFDKNAKATSLSAEDVLKIENLINEKINQYNKGQKESDSLLNKMFKERHPNSNTVYSNSVTRNPSQYYTQLIATINTNSEKIVYVNCFCSASAKSSTDDKYYWQKEIITVDDGGNCYFQLKINLTKGIIYDFMVNGVA